MSLRKIAKKKVVTVRPDETVVKAARLMGEKNVGSVVVVENRKPIGILTDRDIAIRVVAKKADINSILVKQVMTKRVITGRDGQRVAELAKVMHEHGIRRVPIVSKKGVLIGISISDLKYPDSTLEIKFNKFMWNFFFVITTYLNCVIINWFQYKLQFNCLRELR